MGVASEDIVSRFSLFAAEKIYYLVNSTYFPLTTGSLQYIMRMTANDRLLKKSKTEVLF